MTLQEYNDMRELVRKAQEILSKITAFQQQIAAINLDTGLTISANITDTTKQHIKNIIITDLNTEIDNLNKQFAEL